ncbi:hypothetical protein ABZ369_22010 [Streptomyces sp. NPDC005918]|uniref:hypothetical protein n=1 Tax=Streptomyces sp. NPDC005918 TaxID=3155454 RepID=UPI0034095975
MRVGPGARCCWTAGRPSGPGAKTGQAKAAARIRLAAEAQAAMPGRKAGEAAAELADEHGHSVDTWKRAIPKGPQAGSGVGAAPSTIDRWISGTVVTAHAEYGVRTGTASPASRAKAKSRRLFSCV